jgi:hypothetical protein
MAELELNEISIDIVDNLSTSGKNEVLLVAKPRRLV